MDATHDGTEHTQYLTFRVAGRTHGIPVLDVREILPFRGATKVPLAPEAIRGLINLRGTAVPVLDLAVEFGLPETEVTKRACVVILDPGDGREGEQMGILSEEVEVVLPLGPDEVEPAPSFGSHVKGELLSGVGRVDGEFIPILDARRLLDLERFSREQNQTSQTEGGGGSSAKTPEALETSEPDAAEKEGDSSQESEGPDGAEDESASEEPEVGDDPSPDEA